MIDDSINDASQFGLLIWQLEVTGDMVKPSRKSILQMT
jgi:hypothetical protein